MTLSAWAGAAAALIFSLVASLVLARCGPVDTVKARSSHRRPTPTSGGLAVIAGACAGAAVSAGDPVLPWLFGAAAGLGLFGAADDLRDFPPAVKFGAQVLATAVLVFCGARVSALPLGPGAALDLPLILGAAGSAVFVLLLLNAVNFMDGANGLIAGVAALAFSSLATASAWAGEAGLCAAALAGAAANLGFLGPNVRGALFQGDAGAFFSATLLGGLALALAERGAATPWLVGFAVLPLLVDVLMTLAVRARRRARLTEAHREHLYQLWLQHTGKSHGSLALRVWGLAALSSAIGLAAERSAPSYAFAVLMVLTAVGCAGWLVLRRVYAVRAAA